MNSAQDIPLTERLDRLLAGPSLPPIVQAGHPALRRRAQRYDGQLDDARLTALIAVMRQVMHAAPGVGLAAPQLGIGLALAVLEDAAVLPADITGPRERTGLEFLTIINPSYAAVGSESAAFYEGCLSVRGYQAVVERPRQVDLDYEDAAGGQQHCRLSGWSARMAQHETDHLGGTIYLDKAQLRSLSSNEEHARRWAQPTIEPARRTLGF